jgi:hypothetical protein
MPDKEPMAEPFRADDATVTPWAEARTPGAGAGYVLAGDSASERPASCRAAVGRLGG